MKCKLLKIHSSATPVTNHIETQSERQSERYKEHTQSIAKEQIEEDDGSSDERKKENHHTLTKYAINQHNYITIWSCQSV